ncbi:MAG TPA: protoporphyrinogen oxidase [Bacillales bacterium]|nr:protoporphyrinogen oxidase [Bacillales bacterium]
MKKHVVIIGGGITGLTAAFYLQREIRKHRLPVTFTLIEMDDRLGGKIDTLKKDGFVIERGPDSFLARKTSAVELVQDAGLEDALVRNRTGQAYVLNDDVLHPIPKGTAMGIPIDLSAFTDSELLSPAAKARSALDLVLPRRKDGDDPSVGNFFRRRLGGETVDKLIEPLLSGIYAGDLDRLSLKATFPQFYELEQKERSLMVGMRKSRANATDNGAAKGQFLTLRDGLSSLVEKLEAALPAKAILKGSSISDIRKQDDRFRITTEAGKSLHADAVISTVPHEAAETFLPGATFLRGMGGAPATTVATIAMAFRADQVRSDQDGTGFVVSRKAGYQMTACTWTHKKWPHTVPKGRALLRCYVGKPGDEAIVNKPDDEMARIVLSDLKRVMTIDGEPAFTVVTRWRRAMPQYVVGHLSWLHHLRTQTLRELPGLYFAGASYEGVGLPDCIKQGKKAAQDALHYANR